MILPNLAPDLPFLSPNFGSHMVLQRDKPNSFWGWATPGEEITVSIGGRKASTKAGLDGKWLVRLTPPKAGGPYQLLVQSSKVVTWDHQVGSETIKVTGLKGATLDDVMVGDVWLCTGQSNMEFGLSQSAGGSAEVAAANEPNIRLFMAGRGVGYEPLKTIGGEWKVCTPKTILENGWGGFSAVGYYFGKRLQRDLKVPIGLIQTCWGGTSAEAWTSAEGLRPLGDFASQLAMTEKLLRAGGPVYGTYTNLWLAEYDQGAKESWQGVNLDEARWKAVQVPPGPVGEGLERSKGVVWFRKTIDMPVGGTGTLYLNRIADTDTTWVNGELLGTTMFDWAWRQYPITLKPGRNVIAVRVFTNGSANAFLGQSDQVFIELADGSRISLEGEWKSRVGINSAVISSKPRDGEPNPTVPTTLFNGMIAPLAPMAVRGAIWYQGETNSGRGAQYRRLLPAMIADWRRAFGQEFPFYIVSLANFMERSPEPGDDYWAELRESQAVTAMTVPKSGLAVAIDLGESNDVHPKDKKSVGERLALNALAREYGRKIEYSGPVYQSMAHEGDAIRLRFSHAKGLMAKGTLEGFAVAGADRKWHWAEARIEGEAVVVRASAVPAPIAVRYAWGHNPAATLYNGSGLPAVPFRTDDWPMLSANSR